MVVWMNLASDGISLPSTVVASPKYIERPWSSSQILSGKGANNGHFEGEHLVQLILTKVGLRLPKALVITMSWAPW